jgi:ABC-2 type transport system permease protein
MSATLRLLRSEWRKMSSIPTMWWLLGGTVLLTAAGCLLGLISAEMSDLAPNTGQGLKEGLHSVGAGSQLAEIAAIIGMAGEFRFGQANQTFLSEPRRTRVVLTKLVNYAVLGAVFGILTSLAAFATTWIWLTAKGIGLPMRQDTLWLTLTGAVISAVFFAMIGVAVGAAMRNQVLAIVTVLAVQVVLETALFAASRNVGRFLPGEAGDSLRRLPADGLLSPGMAAVALGCWVVGILVIGIVRLNRSDVVA